LQAIDDGAEAPLEEPDQVLRGVAGQADGLTVKVAELPFGEVAVVGLELLLGGKLRAVVGKAAAARLAMLPRAVIAAVDGAFRAAPEVLPQGAVDLVLRGCAFGH